MFQKVTGTFLSLIVGAAGLLLAAPSASAGTYLDGAVVGD